MDCNLPGSENSLEFSRQESWNELPFLPSGDLPNAGIKLTSLASPALANGFITTTPPGKQFLKNIFLIHGWLNPWIWNSKTQRANCICNFQHVFYLKDSLIFRVQILKYSEDSKGLKYLHLSTSPLRASVNKALLPNPVSLEWSEVLSTEWSPWPLCKKPLPTSSSTDKERKSCSESCPKSVGGTRNQTQAMGPAGAVHTAGLCYKGSGMFLGGQEPGGYRWEAGITSPVNCLKMLPSTWVDLRILRVERVAISEAGNLPTT